MLYEVITMNGQMKTLIDRTYARYTEISNKEFYFIMTAAVSRKALLERTLEGFSRITSYNVCYTKLLRAVFSRGRMRVRAR